jgi:hypothetical protein
MLTASPNTLRTLDFLQYQTNQIGSFTTVEWGHSSLADHRTNRTVSDGLGSFFPWRFYKLNLCKSSVLSICPVL